MSDFYTRHPFLFHELMKHVHLFYVQPARQDIANPTPIFSALHNHSPRTDPSGSSK